MGDGFRAVDVVLVWSHGVGPRPDAEEGGGSFGIGTAVPEEFASGGEGEERGEGEGEKSWEVHCYGDRGLWKVKTMLWR